MLQKILVVNYSIGERFGEEERGIKRGVEIDGECRGWRDGGRVGVGE